MQPQTASLTADETYDERRVANEAMRKKIQGFHVFLSAAIEFMDNSDLALATAQALEATGEKRAKKRQPSATAGAGGRGKKAKAV